jgi:Tfp pilus assembly protein PilO
LNKDILKKDISLKNVLIIVLVFMVIGIYIYKIIYPQYQNYISTKENIESTQTKINEYKQDINNIDSLKENLSNVNTELKIKSNKLDYEMNDGMFLIGLSNTMKQLGVNLLDYTIDKPIKYTTFYATPNTIKVEGNYRRVREVMYYLEEQKNMTQILDFNMVISEPEEVVIPSFDGNIEITDPNDAEADDNTEITVPNVPTVPEVIIKPSDNIIATFKFIVYSAYDTTVELNTSNPNKWKPGKFNPFAPTVDNY